MSRAKHCLVTAALAALTAMGGVGCADDYLSLVVIHNQAVIPEECAPTPTIEEPYLPHGIANVAVGGYILTPLVQSNLTNRNDMTNGDIITIKTASVEINPVDSDDSRAVVAALNELRGATRHFYASVSPGGLTSLSFEAIDGAQARALATAIQPGQAVEVIASTIIYGDVGGGSVKSAPFEYPITLLNVENGSGVIDLGACSGLPTGFEGAANGCFDDNGQDNSFIECCSSGAAQICPAKGTGS
jgi:hypothetical protein